MTPTQQPQERVTLVMLYNELKEINKSISAIGTAQAVNSTQIAGIESGLGEGGEKNKKINKKYKKK